MRKYFFDKTNIRNILAITGLLFATLTFLMFFVTGNKGYVEIPESKNVPYLIFSGSLFALAFGKGYGVQISTASFTEEQLKLINPGQSIILIVAFTLALAALLIAITVAIGMLYKKFNRKVLLGLSITGVVLLFATVGLLSMSNGFMYYQNVDNIMNVTKWSGTREDFIQFLTEDCFFKVQPAIGTILGCTFGTFAFGSGIAAIIFTRYSISNRQ